MFSGMHVRVLSKRVLKASNVPGAVRVPRQEDAGAPRRAGTSGR